tara:strand:+ start:174 stop:350 length:177 start_codon:yes stop_codon:yes gene_type:complete
MSEYSNILIVLSSFGGMLVGSSLTLFFILDILKNNDDFVTFSADDILPLLDNCNISVV